MATVKGDNRTKHDDPTSTNIVDQGVSKADLQVIYDTYEASALPINDIIQVGDNLPTGARIYDIKVMFDDLGTSVTMDVGDSADDDRYATAIDVATAAGGFSLVEDGNIAGFGYEVGTASGDDQITLTIEGGAATGTISVAIQYAH